MNRDIIPLKDQEFHIFQDDVIPKMTTKALAWNIPAPIITELGNLRTAWNAAWSIAKSKENRTPAQTMRKKDARKALTKALRPALQLYIQRNPVVTDADRVGMNIKPQSRKRTRLNNPDIVPLISLVPHRAGLMKVFFTARPGEDGTSRRGKPPGMKACEVYYIISDKPPARPEDCTEKVMATRSPLHLNFPMTQAGKWLHVFGRWLSPTLQPGPWEKLQSRMISY